MAEELKLRAVIESVLDERGFKNFDAAAARASGSMKRTSADSTALAGSFRNLAGTLIGIGSAAAAFNFLRESFLGFAREERQLGAMRFQLKAIGEDSEKTGAEVEAFIAALSQQAGIVDDELIPAFNRLLLGLKSVKAAKEALTIAARFAANGVGTVEQNADSLARALQTGQVRALTPFGVSMDATKEGAERLAHAMEQVVRTAEGMPTSLADTQDKINRVAVAFDTARDALGKWASTVLDYELKRVDRAIEALTGEATAMSRLEDQERAVVARRGAGWLAALRARQSARKDDEDAVAKSDLVRIAREREAAEARAKAEKEGIKTAEQAAALRLAVTRERLQAEIGMEREGTDRALSLQLEMLALEEKATLDEARKIGVERSAIDETFAARRKEILFRHEQAAAEIARNELALERAVLDERAEITELSVEHLLAIRVRALELERRAAISAARETGEDVLAIDTIFALRRARLAAESRREQEEQETRRIETARDSERSLWTAQLQGTQVTGRRRFQLERRQLDEWLRDEIRRVGANEDARTAVLEEHSARTQEIKRQEAAQAAEQNAMVASQGVTMLTAMFGESKALAVAQAIINTYEGASKALAQGGIIGPVMAALIIATGLGYVKTIMAQEPAKAGGGGAGRAGGFDDPTSDMLARERGEAWAGDLLQMLDRGFAAGLARSAPAFAGGQRQAPAPPTIINQRQSTFSPTTNTNVSISGWVGAGRTEMAKRLQRELLRIDRQVVRRGRIRG